MDRQRISHIGSSWNDVEKDIFTPEDIVASDLRVNIICEFIRARNEMQLTQKQLETLTGIRQPMLARIENGQTDPQLSTVLKMLAPLGKTLAVVPLK